MATDIGTGTTVTFGTSGFTFDLLDVGGPGLERGSVDTTHMGTTTARTFMPTDLYDPGGVDIEGAHLGSLSPPIGSAAETITIDWAGSGNTWSGSGFMTNYNPSAPLEDKMTFTATLKMSGPITIS